jgi:hypothetical protein
VNGLPHIDTCPDLLRRYSKPRIKEHWDRSYHITRLAHGDNQWVVIISQGAGYADTQPYVWRDYFPEAELREYWTPGHHITSLAYGDPQWAVVMSQKQQG